MSATRVVQPRPGRFRTPTLLRFPIRGCAASFLEIRYEITRGVLARAGQPLPDPARHPRRRAPRVGDGMARKQFEGLVFATHDAALAAAAQANGFDVIGTIRHRGPRVSGAR